MASVITPTTPQKPTTDQPKSEKVSTRVNTAAINALPFVTSPSLASNGEADASPTTGTSQTAGGATTRHSDDYLLQAVEHGTGPMTQDDIENALHTGRISAREAAELQRQITPKPHLLADEDEEDEDDEHHHVEFGDGEDAISLAAMTGAAAGGVSGVGMLAKAALAARAFKRAFEKHIKKARERFAGEEPRIKLVEMTKDEGLKAEAKLRDHIKKSGITNVNKELAEVEKATAAADKAKQVAVGGEEAAKGLRGAEEAVAATVKVEKAGVTAFRAARALRTGVAIGGAVAVGTVAAVAAVGTGLVIGAVALTAVAAAGTYFGVKYIMQNYGNKSDGDASQKAAALSGQVTMATLKDQTIGFAQDAYDFSKNLVSDPKATVTSTVEAGIGDVKAIGEVADVGIALWNSDQKTRDAAGTLANSMLEGKGADKAYANFMEAAKSNPELMVKIKALDSESTKKPEAPAPVVTAAVTPTPSPAYRGQLREVPVNLPPQPDVTLIPASPPSGNVASALRGRGDLRTANAALINTKPKAKTNAPDMGDAPGLDS